MSSSVACTAPAARRAAEVAVGAADVVAVDGRLLGNREARAREKLARVFVGRAVIRRGQRGVRLVATVALAHPERLEHAPREQVFDRESRRTRRDLAEQRPAVVRVGPLRPGRHLDHDPVGIRRGNRALRTGLAPQRRLGVAKLRLRRRLADPAGVREQVAHAQAVRGAVEPEAGDPLRDAIVEPELALLDERHHHEPDHRLRNRADALARGGILRAPRLEVGVADPDRERHVARRRERQAEPGQVPGRGDALSLGPDPVQRVRVEAHRASLRVVSAAILRRDQRARDTSR